MDDEAWQAYAAKSFPTFERKSIVEGSVPGEIVREREGGSSVVSGSASRIDFSKPMGGIPETQPWTPPTKRKTGGAVSIVVAILIIGGIAGSIWFFFLRTPTDNGNGQEGRIAGLTISKFQAHTQGTGITTITPQSGGVGFYTGGEDGFVHRWIPGQTEPEASQRVAEGAVTEIVLRSDNQRLVVGTSTGSVLLMDAKSLKVMRTELTINARVTALLPIGVSELVVGDSQGRLTVTNGARRVQVDADGAPVVGLAYRNDEVWAAAGRTIAVYTRSGGELTEKSTFGNLPEKIHSLMATGDGVYGVVGKQVHRMSPQGPAPAGFDVRFSTIGRTYDDAFLIVIGSTGVVMLNPGTLEQVATAAIERNETILSIGPSPQKGRFYLGTRSGELYQCTFD